MNKPVQVPARFRLHCLGHARLEDLAGHDLTPRTRKARALLAYFALTGRSSRERLADLLWSDRGPAQARSSLRQAMFELRHLTEPEATLFSASLPDEISFNRQLVTTDLEAVRRAAKADEYREVEGLLATSEGGLLTDLDGLDPEFDGWLRMQRAREPSQSLAIALAAADRCFDRHGPAEAAGLVAELQRLDTCSEEVARLALRIADRIGDRGALHRHYDLLAERLKTEFDAEPSPETVALFRQLAGDQRPRAIPRPAILGPLDPLAQPSPARESAATAPPPRWRGLTWAVPTAALAIAALVAGDRRTPPPTPELPLLAVLPFDQQGGTSPALAEGLWDDTRLALSQNRAVRVLGRTTSVAADAQRQTPQDLRRRLGVDYLLEGGVRSQGQKVRIVVSLTRASDGLSVWEQSFDGRMGDPMALQLAVASGIEGHIRGRLAPGGGVHARQIATTPQVYTLYTEARALIRQRGPRQIAAGAGKLRRAIELDPNYAPALASLASTVAINRQNPEGIARDRTEAAARARRAIELAPSLAEAYAALALIQGEHLPSSERLLMHTVALDPGNAEAWNWLGNSYGKRALHAQAMAAYDRAVAIDPYYAAPAANLLNLRLESGQPRAAEALIARIDRAGSDPAATAALRARLLVHQGDYSTAAALLLKQPGAPANWPASARGELGGALLRLGYADLTGQLWSRPSSFGPLIRGEMLPPNQIDGTPIGPRDFWLTPYFGTVASRALLVRNRPDLVVRQYRAGFRSRDDFIRTLDAAHTLDAVVPGLVVALRRAGEDREAEAILGATEPLVRQRLSRAPGDRELSWELARLRAQQGALSDALELLIQARRAGWLPDGHRHPIDIAAEPAMAPLKSNPRFQAIRRQILLHIARERRELGPVRL